MKWVDYREKLGIGFNDEQKLQMLKNKLNHIFEFICEHGIYDSGNYKTYAMMVGEPLLSLSPCGGLQLSMMKENSMVAVISKKLLYVILIQIMQKGAQRYQRVTY